MGTFNIDTEGLKPIFVDFAKKIKEKLESEEWFIFGEAYKHRDDLMDISSEQKSEDSFRTMYLVLCVSEKEIEEQNNEQLIERIIQDFKNHHS